MSLISVPAAPAVADVPLVDIHEVTKSFGHVQALRGASLQIRRGEILALVGDNGAGKSTLVSVLAGSSRPDSGRITFDGSAVAFDDANEAARAGITTVFQDLALCPDLTPTSNVYLGRELRRRGILGWLGFMREAEMRSRTVESLDALAIRLQNPNAPINTLSGGQRQVIAVARASMWARRMLILDEPTAALGARQASIVKETILSARGQGRTILLVSHDLPSVIDIADRIAVMRLGRVVSVAEARTATVPDIVARMLGQGQEASEPPPRPAKGEAS